MKYYLDDSSTMAVDSRVLKEMMPWFTRSYGNPSSPHDLGLEARKKIDQVRTQVARELGAKPHEIIFTSGVTEANNIVFQGLSRASKKKKIIISSVEHASVQETCNYLSSKGYEIVRVPVSSDGLLRLDLLEKLIDDKTLVVSVMHANNVIGTIQDIMQIGKICKRKNAIFHTDASQSFGKLKINVRNCNVDLLSASAHKIGGPKGAGFLYVKDNVEIKPLIFGGGQERGLRGGTENVPAIVGLGKSLEIAKNKNYNSLKHIRDLFISKLASNGGIINGSLIKRLDNNIHVSFPGRDAEMIVARLSKENVYISTGSACDSRREKEDYVLNAIGLDDKAIRGSLRITISDKIKSRDVDLIVKKIISAVEKS